MKKNKKKEFKYLKQILIPSLSVAAVSSIIIPMSICMTKHNIELPYFREDGANQRFATTNDANGTFKYHYNLVDKLPKDAKLYIDKIDACSLAPRPCIIEGNMENPIKVEGQSFDLTLQIKRIDESALQSGDKIGYNISFACKDINNNVLWKDVFYSLELTYKKNQQW